MRNEITAHVESLLAEVGIASILHGSLCKPRNPGHDLTTPTKIDVKLGEVIDYRVGSPRVRPVVGWRNSISETADLDALVVVTDLGSSRVDVDSLTGRVAGHLDLPAIADSSFWVPEAVAKAARRPWSLRHGRDSKGGFWYVGLDEVLALRAVAAA